MDSKEESDNIRLVELLSKLGEVEKGSSEYARLRGLLRNHVESTSSIVWDVRWPGIRSISCSVLLALVEELQAADVSKINKLHFSRGSISIDFYETISKALCTCFVRFTNLTHLELGFLVSGDHLDQELSGMIAEALATGYLSGLLHFSLGRCHTQAIFNAMHLGRVSKLRHLHIEGLSDPEKRTKDSKECRSFLGSGMLSDVVHLSLRNCSVDANDVEALAKAIESNGICRMTYLALPANPLGDESCDGIARLFKSGYLSGLRYLSLSSCQIGDQGMASISRAIVEGDEVNTGLRLEYLDLSRNNLKDGDGIAELFRTNHLTNLKSFIIEACRIGERGAAAIFRAIVESSACVIQTMNMGYNFLGNTGYLELINALEGGHLPELQHLDFMADRDEHGSAYLEEGLLAFARSLEDGRYVGGLLSVVLGSEQQAFHPREIGLAVSHAVAAAFVSAYANNERLIMKLRLGWPDESFCLNAEKYRKRNIALTYARSALEDEEIPNTTGKVFLCGFPMVGKTTLRKSLQRSGIGAWFSRSTKMESHTRGIEVSKIIEKRRREESEVVLSVWDLAGQEEYRVLQSAFCLTESKATTFVIVCRAVYSEPESRKELLFWFKFIASSCEPGVQRHVLVAVNCFDESHSSMKPSWDAVVEEQRKRFLDILHIHQEPFVVNARKPSSTAKLRKHLITLSHSLLQNQTIPKLCKFIPKYLSSWIRENQDYPVLPLEEFLPKIQTVKRERLLAALSFLHETGEIIFLREDVLQKVAYESESSALVSGLVVLDPNWFCVKVIGELLLPASFLKPGQSSVRSIVAADGSVLLKNLQVYLNLLLRSSDQLRSLIAMLMSLGLCYPSGSDRVFIPALISKENIQMWEQYGVKDERAGCWVMGRSMILLEKETMVMPAALFRRLQVNLAQDPEFGVMSRSGIDASSYTASRSSSSFKYKGMIVLVQFDVNESDPEEDRIDILVKPLGLTSEDSSSIRKQQLGLVENIMNRLEPISAYCCPGVQFQRNVIVPWNAAKLTLSMRQRVLIPVEEVKNRVQQHGLGLKSNWSIDDRLVYFDDLLSTRELEEVEKTIRKRYAIVEDGARALLIDLGDLDVQVQTEYPPQGLLDAQNMYILSAVRSEGQMIRCEVRS